VVTGGAARLSLLSNTRREAERVRAAGVSAGRPLPKLKKSLLTWESGSQVSCQDVSAGEGATLFFF
jgi:hypothetical protein